MKMKNQFTKALTVMSELHQVEIERLRMAAPISHEQLSKMYGKHNVLGRF